MLLPFLKWQAITESHDTALPHVQMEITAQVAKTDSALNWSAGRRTSFAAAQCGDLDAAVVMVSALVIFYRGNKFMVQYLLQYLIKKQRRMSITIKCSRYYQTTERWTLQYVQKNTICIRLSNDATLEIQESQLDDDAKGLSLRET